MRLPTPPGRAAAVLLATAVVPLPLAHHHRHRALHRGHEHPAFATSHPGSTKRHPGPAAKHRQRIQRHAQPALNSAATGTLPAATTRAAVRAHLAGDPGDVISDFKFAPATITVHVGDSITWTNNGPSPHSATANNGSFDTGVLQKGHSASHTFTQAGTFTYFCSVHPFMHGTVVVLADTSSSGSGPGSSSGSGPGSSSGSGPGSSSGSGQSSGSSSGSTSSSSGGSGGSTGSGASGSHTSTPSATSNRPTLPLTGIDSVRVVLIGLALAAIGVSLRRKLGARR